MFCHHCHQPLQPCPLGPGCQGSAAFSPATCRSCAWGQVCPPHGTRWTRA